MAHDGSAERERAIFIKREHLEVAQLSAAIAWQCQRVDLWYVRHDERAIARDWIMLDKPAAFTKKRCKRRLYL